MSDEHPTEPTVRSRMLAAPITPERLEEHFRAGRVLLDGEPVESASTCRRRPGSRSAREPLGEVASTEPVRTPP